MYSRMDQVKFVEESLSKFCRPYPFKLIKGCLPQTLLGLFLNTLCHVYIIFTAWGNILLIFVIAPNESFKE